MFADIKKSDEFCRKLAENHGWLSVNTMFFIFLIFER